MNLADPELEMIDPTPNVHLLFIQFDKVFFWQKLASRAVVRWSKRMYSCAGICSYEGRGGLCDIALSEPLLKLRPRKDLVETLLHEMIHAFLFVTNRDQDRDGHGPNFKAHMHRINKSAGLNITIYHSFHDEVKLYQTHWWRCNGPCQKLRPHFGIVRRTMNRAPGPTDYWWNAHKRQCGGTFIKIKEPESKKPPSKKASAKGNIINVKKNVTGNSSGDITKYINTNNSSINGVSNVISNKKPILKDANILTSSMMSKTNSSNTIVGNPPPKPIPVFTGNGYTINNNKHISDSTNVTEQVRNIWANKQIPTVINKTPTKKIQSNSLVKDTGKKIVGVSNANKHKAESGDIQAPPAKLKRIDDYFKANATSVLKDLYGKDFKLTQISGSTKLVAVSVKQELVACPVCSIKVDSKEVNRHLDECLNKDIINELSHDGQIVHEVEPSRSNVDSNKLKEIVGDVDPVPPYNEHLANTDNKFINLNNLNSAAGIDSSSKDKGRRRTLQDSTLKAPNPNSTLQDLVNKYSGDNSPVRPNSSQVERSQKQTANSMRKSDNFITKRRGDGGGCR